MAKKTRKLDALDKLIARLDVTQRKCPYCDDTGLDSDQDTYPDEPCPYCRPTPERQVEIERSEREPMSHSQREQAARFIDEEIRAGYHRWHAIAAGISRAKGGR